MEIRFGFNERTGKIECGIPEKELCLTDYEENFFHTLLKALSKSVDISRIRLEKNSDSYTSICYGTGIAVDFIRFKLTDRTKWMSLSIAEIDYDSNKDNPFFAAQKNKNQRHWKAKLTNIDDFLPYMDLIIHSINEIESCEN